MPIITLTTDFRTGSPYVAAMKGVILSIHPAATIVDITHDIPAQDIARGALVLDDVTKWFPDNSIHIAVVDPSVGTDRAIVYAKIGNQQYIAPDNGLLTRVLANTEPSMVRQLTAVEHWLPTVSTTFHGRDILAPVAARLSLGLDPTLLGPSAKPLVQLDLPRPSVTGRTIRGQVIAIDSFGNLVTNITRDLLADQPRDSRVRISCGVHETIGIHRCYGEHAAELLVAVVGSAGRLELALVGGNAAEQLDIPIGAAVTVTWA